MIIDTNNFMKEEIESTIRDKSWLQSEYDEFIKLCFTKALTTSTSTTFDYSILGTSPNKDFTTIFPDTYNPAVTWNTQPIRVVKIGSDENPASAADITDIQQQLAATANDPNLTITTTQVWPYSI